MRCAIIGEMGISGEFSPEQLYGDQFDELHRVLIYDGARAVVLPGAPGSGKTALAHRFAELQREYFPGGVAIVAAEADASVLPELVDQVAPAQPALIVLDELDRVSVPSLQKELADLYGRRPNAR